MTDPTAWVGVRGVPEHGTRGRYVRGCRCEVCRAPLREYSKRYRAARRIPRKVRSDKGIRKGPIAHGTNAGYSTGCRCEGCREGHNAKARMKSDEQRARDRNGHRKWKYRTENPTSATRVYSAIIEGDPCAYCGASPPSSVDHIAPIHHGGEHDWRNLTAACRSCNSSKGKRSLLTFMAARAA